MVTSHTLIHDEARRPRAGRNSRAVLVQLGWPQFWLLAGILGGMLALVALVGFAWFVSL
jgi:hypothetical protein